MKYYLLVDLGTGNTRVSLVSQKGEILGIRTFTNTYYRDSAYSDAQYFLPSEWGERIIRCCEELHAEFPDAEICAVSSAGARQSIVLIDGSGEAFYGLPNIDNRGRDYMDRIIGRDELYRRSGKWVTEDFCAAKLMGLRMVYPELYSRISKVVSISEWIAFMFTGVAAMEFSQACETQLYDLDSRSWDEELCAAYGIDIELLPPLIPAGEAVGPVLDCFSDICGTASDAVFVMGGADTQVALRYTELSAGDIAVVSGTTSPVIVKSSKRYYDPQQRVWTDADLGGKGFVVEMNPGVTGLNYQRVKDNLCPDLSYEFLEREYAAKSSFCCTASFSSLLFYEQRPLRRGGFFTRSPMDAQLDRVDMAWAVLADIACSIYEQLRRLISLTKANGACIYGCGGGFRSEALCRMLSDLSGMELRLCSGFEQATLQGLVNICGVYLGLPAQSAQSSKSFFPREHSLIHEYYPVWLENRAKANLI